MLNALTALLTLEPISNQSMRVKGMDFDIRAYSCPALGHVSTMVARGMLGLMRMESLIVNPTKVDLPLYSYDRIAVMGRHILIAELVDTTLEPFASDKLAAVLRQYAAIPERDPGAHWYDDLRVAGSISKKGKKRDLDAMEIDHFRAWLETPRPPVADVAAKQEKTRAYVEGLLSNGGPSTDVFKQAIGAEATAKLFRETLFGTER